MTFCIKAIWGKSHEGKTLCLNKWTISCRIFFFDLLHSHITGFAIMAAHWKRNRNFYVILNKDGNIIIWFFSDLKMIFIYQDVDPYHTQWLHHIFIIIYFWNNIINIYMTCNQSPYQFKMFLVLDLWVSFDHSHSSAKEYWIKEFRW